jgi:hypothetical protein
MREYGLFEHLVILNVLDPVPSLEAQEALVDLEHHHSLAASPLNHLYV